MGSTYSTSKDITFPVVNTMDDLGNETNPDKLNFINKIKFLISTGKLSCHGFFGSIEEAKSISHISEGYVKEYLEKINIYDHKDLIESNMPGKIKTSITKGIINKLDYKIIEQINKNENVKNLLDMMKCEYLKKMYKDFDNEEKISIFKTAIDTYSDIIQKKELVNLCLKFSDTNDKKKEIIDFLPDYMLDKESIDKTDKLDSNDILLFVKTQFIEFIDRHVLFTSKLICKLTEYTTEQDKITFVDNLIENADLETANKIIDKIRHKITLDESFRLKEDEIQFEYFKEYMYNDLPEEDKISHTLYNIDFNSHYEFYKSNEKDYTKLLSYNFLTDDFTFGEYHNDDYDFLNGFNDEVKGNIKTKIHADTHRIIDFNKIYNEITTLDNLIDIIFFTENPPYFLKMSGCKYHKKHIDEIMTYLKDFNYDENKLIYKKYRLSFVLCETEQN